MIQFTGKGIYCPQGQFYIDPWKEVDLAVITHAHADHAHRGMKRYLCHQFTRPILESRLGADIRCQGLKYEEAVFINGVKVSLHPAGHVVGSAQIRLEYKGFISVISGDYKLQDDGLSTAFEPVKCHEFVTESTFGLPIYNWLDAERMNQNIRSWVMNNRQSHRTSVLVGYSLGKAQRIMKAVEGMGPVFVHYAIARLNKAIEQSGIILPAYNTLESFDDKKQFENAIVIVPPSLLDTHVIRKIPAAVTGICSGWMQVRGARRWRSADAGFAMSDHADWNDLLRAVKATEAEIVHVTHGQTAVFSKYLNEIGIRSDVVTTQYGEEEEKEIIQKEEGR